MVSTGRNDNLMVMSALNRFDLVLFVLLKYR